GPRCASRSVIAHIVARSALPTVPAMPHMLRSPRAASAALGARHSSPALEIVVQLLEALGEPLQTEAVARPPETSLRHPVEAITRSRELEHGCHDCVGV